MLAAWLGLIGWLAVCPAGPPPPPKSDEDLLRVVTWNIHCGQDDGPPWQRFDWPNRKPALRAALDEVRPDILCVQEATPPQVAYLEQSLPEHERVGIGQSGGQSLWQFVVRENFPAGLGCEHGQRCGRNLFREDNLHRFSLFRCGRSVLVKADALLLAQQVEHADDSSVGLALAALVFPDGVGVHAQLLGHLVLIEVELLACDDEFFAEGEFWHIEFSVHSS